MHSPLSPLSYCAEIGEMGWLRSEVRIQSLHMIQCTSGCTSDSAVHAVTYISPVLSVSDLPLLDLHLGQPHLLHSTRPAHESVKAVTAGLVSTKLKVCQNSCCALQVCVWGQSVVMCACRWAPRCHFWPPGISVTSAGRITALILQLDMWWPENWTS